MKKVRMNISHSRFILFNLKIFGEIVTTYDFSDQTKKVSRILKSSVIALLRNF